MTAERLFFGVPLPPNVSEAIRKAVSGTPVIADRAGPSDNWHVTLRFLGPTDAPRKQAITRAVDAADLPHAFQTRVTGWGTFPRPASSKIFWVGLADPDGHLKTIANLLEAAARLSGFAPEERPFRPHVTLARFREPTNLRSTIEKLPAVDMAFLVDHFVLFRSHLGAGPPRYEPLQVHRLPA